MGQHLAAWFENLDAAVLARLATVQDSVLTPSGTERFLVPGAIRQGEDSYNWIHWAFATGASLTGARIVTPSLEVMKSDLDINPFQDGADLINKIAPSIWIPPRPIQLVESEGLEVQASEDAGGASTMQVFVSLGTAQNMPMADGPIRSVRFTGTTTLTADQWTAVTLTPESSLEAGRYQLVHFSMHGVTPIAARMLPQGGGFRPGMFAFAAADPAQFHWVSSVWDSLGWHNMLEFTHNTIPQLEVFATAGDTAQTVQAYVIRLGDI